MIAVAPLLLNSITDAGPKTRDQVVVTGSHGGVYAAYLASKAGVRACIFNDAGIGYENAGVAGMTALDDVGMAAAAVDCRAARIGDAQDMMDRGIISAANRRAAALGAAVGVACREAASALMNAPPPTATMAGVDEARSEIDRPNCGNILVVDSASLIKPEDAGRIVVTGSHGGLIGGNPARAVKADVRLVVFNDAGVGIDEAGVTRLPALDRRGIAGLTVAHTSAPIGDALTTYRIGVISRVNGPAARMGAREGMDLASFLDTV